MFVCVGVSVGVGVGVGVNGLYRKADVVEIAVVEDAVRGRQVTKG